jgi:hypothetical protein
LAFSFSYLLLIAHCLSLATRYGGDGGIGGTFPLMVVLKRWVVFIRTQSSVLSSQHPALGTGYCPPIPQQMPRSAWLSLMMAQASFLRSMMMVVTVKIGVIIRGPDYLAICYHLS